MYRSKSPRSSSRHATQRDTSRGRSCRSRRTVTGSQHACRSGRVRDHSLLVMLQHTKPRCRERARGRCAGPSQPRGEVRGVTKRGKPCPDVGARRPTTPGAASRVNHGRLDPGRLGLFEGGRPHAGFVPPMTRRSALAVRVPITGPATIFGDSEPRAPRHRPSSALGRKDGVDWRGVGSILPAVVTDESEWPLTEA